MSVFLKKVEIFGFKSFADRTKIEFSSPITAIIGPNGSGKSNIIDAIRWVLGENSTKTLRGNTFEDIIFAGSQYRSSLSVAEVSLSFDNSRRILQIPFDEIEITKRYYRSGEGKILINRQEARVKDIINLFLGTGFGKEGYSIVGQGEVDKLVVGTPQEKRNYIDELLGISKVKFKKKEAEKRLQDINYHLSTITVKLESTEREYNRVIKEKEKLVIYKQLSEKLEYFEKLYAVIKIKQHQKEVNTLLQQKEKISKEIENLSSELHSLSQQLQSSDTLIQEESAVLSKKREEFNNIEKTIKSKELEKKSLESKVEMAKRSIEIFLSSITKESQRKEELIKEKHILQKNIEKLSQDISENQKKAEQLNFILMELEKERENLEKQKLDSLSKIEFLRDTIRKIDNISREIQWIQSKKENFIKAKDELSLSIENIRSSIEENERNKKLVIEEVNSLKQKKNELNIRINEILSIIKETEENINELQTVISNLSKQSEKMFQDFSKNISSSALKIGEFINKVDITSQKIIGICDIMEKSDYLDTQQMRDKINEVKKLSLSIYEDIKNLPFLASATEFISKKIEIDENIISLRKNLEETIEKLSKYKEKLSEQREKQKEIEIIISTKEDEIFRYEKQIDSLLRDMKLNSQKLENTEKEIEQNEIQIKKLTSDLTTILHRLNDHNFIIPNIDTSTFEEKNINIHNITNLRNYLEDQQRSISFGDIEDKVKELELKISEKRNELIRLETENTVVQSNIKSSKERISQIDRETSKIEEFITSKQKEVEIEEQNINKNQIELQQISKELEKFSSERDELLKVVSEKSHRIKELNQKFREVISKKDEISSKLTLSEKEFFGIEEKIAIALNNIDNLNNQILEKYGIRINEIENEFSLEEMETSIEEITKEITILKNEIKKLGFINELADEEFNKIQEEYLILKNNLDDILQSKQKLETMITEINEEIEKIVRESLDNISSVITDVFKEVFGGGGVKIEIDNNDLIEGGIELSVSIPGKKIRNLLLLSGGEKALVGIIFIFSALMINNTPVVIMDEVDAPLDDENTERFKHLILAFQDKTQFIIVSHNKSTIEICQDIYGVTMEEKGVSKVVSYKLQEVII